MSCAACRTTPATSASRSTPGYKSNRRKTRKPVGYVAFCDWVRETYSTASTPQL